MAVTIKTIAEKINISNQAVSAVLNNKTNCRVSPQKRELILETARQLGYISSISAQIVRGKATKTIALLVSSPYLQQDEFLIKIILDLLNRLNSSGYDCFYSLVEKDAEKNLKIVKGLISRGVTAFIILGEPFGRAGLEELTTSQNCGVVFYGARKTDNFVDTDSNDAIREIIQFFIKSGHGNFRAIFSPFRMSALCGAFPDLPPEEVKQRYLHKIHMPNTWSSDLQQFIVTGYHDTRRLLKSAPKTEAIFYHSDIFAIGGIQYLTEHGYRIGEDILVAGVNNTLAIRNQMVPVSSIEHDTDRITDCIYEGIFSRERAQVIIPAKACIRTRVDYSGYAENKKKM